MFSRQSRARAGLQLLGASGLFQLPGVPQVPLGRAQAWRQQPRRPDGSRSATQEPAHLQGRKHQAAVPAALAIFA